MKNQLSTRRRFVFRLSALVAAVGGVTTALLPEYRAFAAGPPPRALAPSPSQSPTLQTNTYPEAPPLPSSLENSLYTAALGDADVRALQATLPEVTRIDPPVRSYDMVDTTGSTGQIVLLPLTSFSLGVPIAYLYFGSGVLTAQGQQSVAMPMRAMATNKGVLRLAGGGQTFDSQGGNCADAAFVSLFPDEYFNLRVAALVSQRAATQKTSLWDRFEQRFGGRFVKTMMAGGDDYSWCMRNCQRSFRTCVAVTIAFGSTAVASGVWSVICFAAATGATVITGGVAAPAIGLCFAAWVGAVAATGATVATAAICAINAADCAQECGERYGPRLAA